MPPQGAINAKNPASLTDPGPHSPAIADQFAAANSPPAGDTNDLPQFWASFNNAAKRIQNGGWARQASQADFAISSTITGVDMRLTAGGIRELHWHPNADEWQYYIKGKAQVGVFTAGPRFQTTNFNPGDIGYVLRNNGHYVRNIGNTDLQFLKVFREPLFCRRFTVRLADAHAARDSCRDLQPGSRDDREVPQG